MPHFVASRQSLGTGHIAGALALPLLCPVAPEDESAPHQAVSLPQGEGTFYTAYKNGLLT